MSPTIIDQSLFCQYKDYQLIGIHESRVEDLLRVGTDNSKTHYNENPEQFETTERQQLPISSAQMYVTDFEDKFHIDAGFYMSMT